MSLSQNIEANVSRLDDYIDEVILIEAAFAAELLKKEIKVLRAGGVNDDEIRRLLKADFDSKGRIFGQIENATKARVAGLISAASNNAAIEVYKDAGMPDAWRWVTVNLVRGGNVCPDCPTRHGRVETSEEWQRIGEPGSGWSVCGPWDYCILVPEAVTFKEIVNVIR